MSRGGRAAMLVINAAALLYCVVTMPVELAFLDDLDFCTAVPTLQTDMATDILFLVRPPPRARTARPPPPRAHTSRDSCACRVHTTHQ